MKKITLLILAAMFCIGTLTLLGCTDEPDVVELEPVEEIQEEPDVEEVVELEPEPEPLYFGEEIEPIISEAELNTLIAATADRVTTLGYPDHTVRENLEIVLDYVNARPLPNQTSYDRASWAMQSLVGFDFRRNDLQVLRAMRDSRTNSVLRDKYNDLIEAIEILCSDSLENEQPVHLIQDYIDALKEIDAGLHPEVVGEREMLLFFKLAIGPIAFEACTATGNEEKIVTIDGEEMSLGAAFATNKMPFSLKHRDIRRMIDAGELD